MDQYDRLVYRAFGVPDVLTPENQLRSAGARLLAMALNEQEREGDDYDVAEVRAKPGYFEAGASCWVVTAARQVQAGAFDPALGGYAEPGMTPDTLRSRIYNEAENLRFARQHGTFPAGLGWALTRAVISVVLSRAGSVDALRQARLDLEIPEA